MILVTDLIKDGIIYQKDCKSDKWYRKCPSCNEEVEHQGRCSKYKARDFHVAGRKCKPCKDKLHGNVRRGIRHTFNTRYKQSCLMKQRQGRKHSQETKDKIRSIVLKAVLEKGDTKVDKGAPEYFQYQNEQGFSFIENYPLLDIGYVLDAYDPVNQIIAEYDTPYHRNVTQQSKDMVRQRNIIEYFKKQQIPLKAFIRVDATKI